MSFRQFGGINYAPKHNIVASNYNTSNNLLVTQNVGQPNSYINFLSDISGNIIIYGDVDISGNLTVGGDIDCSGNVNIDGNVDISNNLTVGGDIDCSGNVTAYYMFLSSGPNYSNEENAVMPKSYIDLVSTGINPVGKVVAISTDPSYGLTTIYPVPIGINVPSNFQIDGVTLNTKISTDPSLNVLLNDQTDPSLNGIYSFTFNNTTGIGQFNRSTTILPTGSDAKGAFVSIIDGTAYARTGWVQTYTNTLTDTTIVGTDPLQFNEYFNVNFRDGQGLNTTTGTYGINYLNVDTSLNFLTLVDASSSYQTLCIGTENATTINMGKTTGITQLNGLLGIGLIPDPSYNLDVSGNIRTLQNIYLGSNTSINNKPQIDSSSNLYIFFKNQSTDYAYINWYSPNVSSGDTGSYLQIGTADNGSTYNSSNNEPIYFTQYNYTGPTYSRMRIDASGVFINPSSDIYGTNFSSVTDASYQLNVNANAIITGNTTVSGTLSSNLTASLAYFGGSVTVGDSVNNPNSSLNVYGNASVSGTLGVTGNTSLSTLSTSGMTTLNGGLQVNNNVTFNSAGGSPNLFVIYNNADAPSGTPNYWYYNSTLMGYWNNGGTPAPAANWYILNTGNATFSTVSAQTFNSTSDYRLKTNIKRITNYTVDDLKPIEYDINDKHDMGFLAHEVQEHYPFLVDGEKDGDKMQSINYNGFIALLVKEIQNLKKEVEELKQKIK